MSYSRWGHSMWYTFWTSTAPDDDEYFEVMYIDRNDKFTSDIFSYTDLQNERVRPKILRTMGRKAKANQLDLLELEVYMLRFVENVDEEIKSQTFDGNGLIPNETDDS